MSGNSSSGGAGRKPLRVHQLHGTYRDDRHGQPSKATSTGGDLPPKPDLDPIAAAMWDLVTETRAPWLAESDGPALQALCEAWALRCSAHAALRDDATAQEPRVAFTAYQAAFERLAARFGLTPTDRARMGEVLQDDHDPAAEFIA